MQLLLIADLCQQCARTKKLADKLLLKERIVDARHKMIVEANGRPSPGDDELWDAYMVDYEDMVAFLKEMEICCFACASAHGLSASIHTMIQEFMVYQIKEKRLIEAEAEELGEKHEQGSARPKVITAERLERARQRKLKS